MVIINIFIQIKETRKKSLKRFNLADKDVKSIKPLIRSNIKENKEVINYLKNRSDSVWKLINFQYSEFYPVEMVEHLTIVYKGLINLRQAIQQYQKHSSLEGKEEYYQQSGVYMISKNNLSLLKKQIST